MSVSPGTTLELLRERKPLVHQITNYVVMNETANATLALGALPVMAHAREEVEEMVGLAGALVLNIGTLSPHWVEAMIAAGKAANAAGIPVVLDPVGAGATRYRTDTTKRILAEVDVTVLRGNQARSRRSWASPPRCAAWSRSAPATIRWSSRGSRGTASGWSLLSRVVDHVSDGDRVLAVANGHELLASVTGTGCMSSAITGCFLAAKREQPLEAAVEGARRVRRRRRGRRARRKRTGQTSTSPLRRARRARFRPRSTAAP
jgi:hydroxyethylthiazole kinase